MKFTPSVVIDAPTYYVDHFNGRFNTDKCVILRNMQLETDSELMTISLRHLPHPVQILDLTNNELTEFPYLRDNKDIHTLLLSRNQISQLNGDYLPRHLVHLVICNNNIVSFEQLNGLQNCPKSLRSLQLRGNRVIHLEGYREYVLRLIPSLQILDYSRVSDQERKHSKSVELSDRSIDLKKDSDIMPRDKDLEMMHMVIGKMSEERKKELNEQLANATSLDEISRIEKLLSGGV
ncbi:hypothetical protein ZYGR_0P02850 [Zygosaccharomyces rouxii]|uniref:U2 small nuclear ribonucleoprotein A' n=2 Tax=Zygosaccharomyces rouxii TaxID=4956 RepID=C5E4M0_ZYGRC|nr:uncharacterized protein ZYRO0E07194g [Zygosaccharomyces rouxii]KAH9198163.1 hypothetical protein LQ764DRAFT_154855 [Zygosaccharomyces rouxii]GAV49640.1 hypothetical protein ZYGR_0P02850 [Zygosaccharomyces rouxii]CAR30981.1 ZYRO0E07194p [Zygosaccharomyces rouxii]